MDRRSLRFCFILLFLNNKRSQVLESSLLFFIVDSAKGARAGLPLCCDWLVLTCFHLCRVHAI